MARFSFTAANHDNSAGGLNKAEIATLVFRLSAINVAVDSTSFYLYNSENSSVTSPCSASDTTGTITITCEDLDESSVNTAISQGGSIDLILHGTVDNPQVSPGVSILQAILQNLDNPAVPGTVEWTDEVTNFDWVDVNVSTVKSTYYRLD